MPEPVHIFWFRRDLRITDNAGLYHALKQGIPVLPIFIFDQNILEKLEDKTDRRVLFIYQALLDMQRQLEPLGSSLRVYYGKPEPVFRQILSEFSVAHVSTNRDYEPYARERDLAISDFLHKKGIPFHTYKDQVIFDTDEVLKDDGSPYTVFTPYSKKWKWKLNDFYLSSYPVASYFHHFLKLAPIPLPALEEMGFIPVKENFPQPEVSRRLILEYGKKRDFPGLPGTSRLSVHLRFGTISVRELARTANKLSDTFLNELIWRDFYHMILWHFPRVGKGLSFRPEYDNIKWRNNETEFQRWCEGNTGYPIVDAGMRELNKTGYMHNRVRMIVASFLTKHLLIDWRWGEAYFASKLLDFDLAANNGGWQWAAGSGCDAAPYFRIFNPYLQTKKFDPNLSYISRWVPEYNELHYPPPMVDHDFARKRCLEVYTSAVGKKK